MGDAKQASLTERLIAEGRARPATRTVASLPKPLSIRLPRPLSAVISDDREDRV